MRNVAVVLCLIFLLGSVVPVEAVSAPGVSADGAVLMCAESGEYLYEHNADKRLSMASTTKIITAAAALDNCMHDCIVTVGNEVLSAEGTMLGLEVGDTIRLYDLVLAMMLSSGNDAANAVAVAVSGSLEEFAVLMNDYAHNLGLTHTNFVTPSGLDAEEHYTSARDLAILTRYAMQIPEFVDICSSTYVKISLNDGAKTLNVYNHNKLLSKYPGTIGVKTGFTKKSGRCLVSAAEKNGVTLIAVTLNAPDDWNDHIKLLNYGFSKADVCISPSAESVYSVDVVGADGCSKIGCSAVIPGYVCSQQNTAAVEERICIEPFVYAPVKAGDCVGYIEYVLNGRVINRSPLCARDSISTAGKKDEEEGFFTAFFNKIIGWFTHGRN